MIWSMNLPRLAALLITIFALALPSMAVADTPPAGTAPVSTAAPVISGDAWVGYQLSCSQGAWTGTDPITYAYTWLAAGATVSSGQTYTPIGRDRHATLVCQVKATNAVGTATAASAPTSEPVADRPPVFASNLTRPAVIGRALIGKQLICNIGTWDGGYPTATYRIQWLRGAEVLQGQEEPTYIVTARDALQQMSCQVIARNDAGDRLAQSLPTAIVPAPVTKVSIGLVVGNGSLEKPVRGCGRRLSTACKQVADSSLGVTGALTVKVSAVPMVLIVERRAKNGTWHKMSFTKFTSQAGSYQVSLPSSFRKAAAGSYRVHLAVIASAKAQKASSPLLYVNLLAFKA